MSVNINNLIGAVTKARSLARFVDCALVGTAYTMGPEHAKDIDLLILMKEGSSVYGNRLLGEPGGSAEADAKAHKPNADLWTSYRDGEVNFLVTNSKDFYDRSVLAAEVCKVLKLSVKGDRIAVYRVIRDGLKAGDPGVWAA